MDLGTEATASSHIVGKNSPLDGQKAGLNEEKSVETIGNPGEELDEMGVTCAQLFERFRRTGNHQATDGMWNALQEFAVYYAKIDSQYGENVGEEM